MTKKIKTNAHKLAADMLTPVSVYLRIRDRFPNSIMLESADYQGSKNSLSFICFQEMASFSFENNMITTSILGKQEKKENNFGEVLNSFRNFIHHFSFENQEFAEKNGFFGYNSYDFVQATENIELHTQKTNAYQIPDIVYVLYRYVLCINHFNDELLVLENFFEGEESQVENIIPQLFSLPQVVFPFQIDGKENSNIQDEEFMQMVTNAKFHCEQGDVFQIVLSRQFSQAYKGDDFNLYRALRMVNPSPYLFYFDFGNFTLMGSSPEAQLLVQNQKAYINPIAGTFRRTGDDEKDAILAQKLLQDPKENAEHTMLVDLARNDLSRNSTQVHVKTYKEIQYYSHVIHLVSTVEAQLDKNADAIQLFADTFPAGTLTGAPKYKAMQLIDKYENQNRSFYGGSIGMINTKKELNQAILIRSFLSKNNTLYFQAGAGIVIDSQEENELQEVKNKLAALRKALEIAQNLH